MDEQQKATTERAGDSSDVVSGDVGDAHLVDPAEGTGLGADLDRLPAVGSDSGSTGETGSTATGSTASPGSTDSSATGSPATSDSLEPPE